MKLYNSMRRDQRSSTAPTRLLIQPQDNGIWFILIKAYQRKAIKVTSIVRSYLEPWKSSSIRFVQDSELAELVRNGCLRIFGDDHALSIALLKRKPAPSLPSIHSAIEGTSINQLNIEETYICMPAVWSSQHARPIKRFSKPNGHRRMFSKPFSQRMSTRELMELDIDAETFACLDATASYRLDDGAWQHNAPLNQRYRQLQYSSQFILANRDRAQTIKEALLSVYENTHVAWTSDFSPLDHLISSPQTVIADIDSASMRLHADLGFSTAVTLKNDYGSTSFMERLSARLGELSLSEEELDLRMRKCIISKPPDEGLLDLDKLLKSNTSNKNIEESIRMLSLEYWGSLLSGLENSVSDDARKLIVVGDSPLTMIGLLIAAKAHHWNAEAKWPTTILPNQQQEFPSARAVLRATELFHRPPYEGVHLGNQLFYRSADVLKSTSAALAGTLGVSHVFRN